jgi:hypothetical protein
MTFPLRQPLRTLYVWSLFIGIRDFQSHFETVCRIAVAHGNGAKNSDTAEVGEIRGEPTAENSDISDTDTGATAFQPEGPQLLLTNDTPRFVNSTTSLIQDNHNVGNSNARNWVRVAKRQDNVAELESSAFSSGWRFADNTTTRNYCNLYYSGRSVVPTSNTRGKNSNDKNGITDIELESRKWSSQNGKQDGQQNGRQNRTIQYEAAKSGGPAEIGMEVPDKTRIALIIPTTMRGMQVSGRVAGIIQTAGSIGKILSKLLGRALTKAEEETWLVNNFVLLSRVLPALKKSLSLGLYAYTLYIGVDAGDPAEKYLELYEKTWRNLPGSFSANSKFNSNISVKSIVVPGSKSFTECVNYVTKIAYLDGNDYFFRLNDDSKLNPSIIYKPISDRDARCQVILKTFEIHAHGSDVTTNCYGTRCICVLGM